VIASRICRMETPKSGCTVRPAQTDETVSMISCGCDQHVAVWVILVMCWSHPLARVDVKRCLSYRTGPHRSTDLYQVLCSPRQAYESGCVGDWLRRCERCERQVVTSVPAARRCSPGYRACLCPTSHNEQSTKRPQADLTG